LNFDFSEDQKLLQTTVRDFVTDQETLQKNRNVLESDADYDPELWNYLGIAHWNKGDIDAALAAYNMALDLDAMTPLEALNHFKRLKDGLL